MIALTRRNFGLLALTLVATLAPFENAAAQDFPLRPVRLIVPYAPGGSGDLIARLLGDKLSALWGQQVVVENRPGAGGLIGTETAAHAPPDGYTLYLATDGPLTVAATLNGHVPYDWKGDLAPVSMITVGYQVLIVNSRLPLAHARGVHCAREVEAGCAQFCFDRRRHRATSRRRTFLIGRAAQPDACAL